MYEPLLELSHWYPRRVRKWVQEVRYQNGLCVYRLVSPDT